MQGDVSFTFLDRIEEVELNIVDRRWQSALARSEEHTSELQSR